MCIYIYTHLKPDLMSFPESLPKATNGNKPNDHKIPT